ncbi:helix-turn-helix transcriptional regulator [Spongiactinospora sp. TRM90649]|uniref:helix-turn-helix domain-containing protein n=1 Tax=Spongiactinospora sp. TRM90649 TaxID=3031114 RepID=UPI0023F6D186|nr:helix-turn-helix transcriptional regulator [Spongiactinospora sp. TRM90649]MDF5753958.1 helix-turn-helix transcriptional regulator [Spongiactinospora sp. TRM90649]
MPYVPTVRGRRLAHEIRRIREAAGLSGEQAARRLGWDQSKISRMENARMRITSGEVMELCEVYSVTAEEREELVRLAREARRQGWWHPYRAVLKTGFGQFLGFEAEAATYRSYDAQVVPGLFQTGDYARAALLGSRRGGSDDADRAVQVRLARQARVTASDRPLNVWQIVEEAALRRVVGGPAIMRGQFRRLLELGELANVSLQVLPLTAGVHAAIDGSFVLLTFDGYPDVLYLEHLMGCVYLEEPEETHAASLVFDHLRAAALNTGDSASLIRDLSDSLV